MKLFITSNFSFSRSVFKRPVLQTHKNQGLLGKGLIDDIQIWDGFDILDLIIITFLNTPFWDHPKFKEEADNNLNVALKEF